ncbi:dTDP-4-dehydrorhamnose 3,5-epimerase family protein [Caldilinea sp.]|jgi:dTDP-4-dehydrorhamnose 3,5-epimerase|uniref:dTDP-4-dehydrorhamnose 3,5-epimerase family protein n=1 Tax=Caldilinea sp. TaxID=2293560 RepID=UPI0026173022|nr:dTDP-4-dehydrorhamnose 3,5-epimerase [uncultured Caldilinea sp.]
MAEIIESSRIAGIKIVRLKVFRDERGRFLETFRKEWFPERTWSIVQTNRSDSRAGVLRGLHYHFHQVDYWYVAQGRIRVGLADLRKDSPTFGASETVEMGEQNEYGLYIPSGVAHGFYALTDATLIYLVDNYYDGGDEFGVAWDDPDLAVPWNVRTPILSARDRANPRLQEIPAEQRP